MSGDAPPTRRGRLLVAAPALAAPVEHGEGGGENNIFAGDVGNMIWTLVIFLLVAGLYNIHKAYTAVTFLLTGAFLAWTMLKLRLRFMGRFYLAFGLLMIPFLIVNGALTGSFTEEPVVWYNNNENMDIRLGTIPVEDVFYGMLMILLPITIWEKFRAGKR